MRIIIATGLLFALSVAHAAAPAYDENADAKADIRDAKVQAAAAKLPVLVVFGANWCPDCRLLDMAMKSGTSAPLIRKSFNVVKVDVGRFNKHTDVAESFGVPLKKGIPAVVVLSPEGNVLYATRGGELADARNMGEQGIYDFFVKVSAPQK